MELKQQICSFENFQYAAFFPEDFSAEDPCPLFIFLHGSGTRGTDINEHLRLSAFFRPTTPGATTAGWCSPPSASVTVGLILWSRPTAW